MNWALVIAGAFLAVYAALTLLRGGKGNRKTETLGCGFVLVAGVVWGLGLAGLLTDFWAGMRLGLAFALVLPALAALAVPGRARPVAAVLALCCAVVLGAGPFPKLARILRSSSPARLAGKVSTTLDQARDAVRDTGQYVKTLEKSRAGLKGQIAGAGYSSFDALARDAKAYALLEELGQVDRLLALSGGRLERLQADVPKLESALRSLERIEAAESATGQAVDESEVERVLERMRGEVGAAGPITVEEHMEREALRQLFEKEF